MSKREHFFFKISKSDFQTRSKVASVIKNLELPENKFPPDFFYQEDGLFIAGYFVFYNQKITINHLVQLCKQHEWKGLTRIIGDFIILYCDLNEKELLILTDQTGKFPCYFSLTPDEFIASTSFYKVAHSIPPLSLNIPEALDYIHRNIAVKDSTIIQEIKQIPPATLLCLAEHWTFSLLPMIEPEEILNQPFEKFKSVEEFRDVFLATLKMIVEERLEVVGDLQFCSELSSGFDSPLVAYLLKRSTQKPFVCYSHIFKLSPRYTNPKTVEEFADKHGLKVHFISHDHLFPFSTNEDLGWMKREPMSQSGLAEAYYDLCIKSKEGNQICFEGHGGDEIYRMDEKTLELNLHFPVQVEYFERLELANFGIDKVLTKRGLDTLFARRRFQDKNPHYLAVSDSAVTIYLNDYFPLFWETKLWPITPFIDPRLTQIARGIPKPKGRHLSKQEIWKGRYDIFVPNQFVKKRGPDEQFKRYLTEKANFLISILENSVLGARGLAKSSEIIDNLRQGNIEKYYKDDAMSYIVNLVGLEYFIQENNVGVP